MVRFWLNCLVVVLLAILVARGNAFAQEKRIALLIGNEDYPRAVGKLTHPHEDVDAIASALRTTGFDVRTLRDAEKGEIEQAASTFVADLARAGSDAVAFFYYSGHGGSQEVVGRRRNYIIPVGAPITTTAELPLRGVALDSIIDSIAAANVRAAFIVSDACRNTLPIGSSKGGAPADRGFEVERRRAGLFIASATAEGETAPDDGAFAQALAKQLTRPGQFAPRAFSLAFREVSQKRTGYRLPSATDALLDDFCFNGCPGSTPASSGGFEAEIAAWVNAKDCDGYAAYLNTYPNGRFAQQARALWQSSCAQPAPPRPVASTFGSWTPDRVRSERARWQESSGTRTGYYMVSKLDGVGGGATSQSFAAGSILKVTKFQDQNNSINVEIVFARTTIAFSSYSSWAVAGHHLTYLGTSFDSDWLDLSDAIYATASAPDRDPERFSHICRYGGSSCVKF